MTKSKRKAFHQAMRDAEKRKELQETPRDWHETVFFPGAGLTVLRLVRIPSFEPVTCWDITTPHDASTFHAYRSAGTVEDSPEVVGYDPLQVAPGDLARFNSEFRALVLPVQPVQRPFGIADGCTVVVEINSQFMLSSRFAWTEDFAPEEWRPLEELFQGLYSLLKAAPPRMRGSDNAVR